MKHSVIVIGGGLAGMTAAIAAHEQGAEVILLDRGSMGTGTNSALANGVFAGPSSGYGPEEYVRDTFESGRMLNDGQMVRMTADGAPAAFDLLRSLGVALEETGASYHSVRPPRPDMIPGLALVRKVADAVRPHVRFMRGFYVTELIRDDAVRGVRGLAANGEEVSIYASAVILAAGGAGAIYEMHDNQGNITGQGYRLAAEAGLPLLDMEFVQFIPVVLAEPHTPRMLLFSPFPPGTRLINEAGEDLVDKYGMAPLNEAVRKRRDDLSLCLFKESRTAPVYIDYREVAPSAWSVHPLVLLSGVKFDFKKSPARILPAAHFFNGGIRVASGRTELPGLFACGEVVWGLHGANRRGGNALTECVVFGQAAGRAAACEDGPTGEERRIVTFSSGPSCAGRLRGLRASLKKLAWEKAGITRDGASLVQALDEAAHLDELIRQTRPTGIKEALTWEDLMSASFVLRAVLTASLARTESRGCFSRSDYPHEDNDQWLRNSSLSYRVETRTFILEHRAASTDAGDGHTEAP